MAEVDQKEKHAGGVKRGRLGRGVWMVSLFAHYIYDVVLDAAAEDWKLLKRDARVFVGTLFLVIGVFGFSSGKYCDGNTADYLSCTRPSTYYYYDKLHILLIILGVFFILFWMLPKGKGK
jgi:hypothetical protein